MRRIVEILLLYFLILFVFYDVFPLLIVHILFALWVTAIFVIINIEVARRLRFNYIRSKFFPGELTLLEYNIMSTFYVLGCITIAKGRVTKEDIKYAENLMDDFKIRPYSTAKQVIVNSFNKGKKNTYKLNDVVAEFCHFFNDNSRARYYYFDYQLTAAMKEGELLAEELAILTTIAEVMGMSEYSFTQKINSAAACFNFKREFYSRNQQTYQENANNSQERHKFEQYQDANFADEGTKQISFSEVENGYDVLGVNKTDDFKTVKKAYRLLIKEYHPDKLLSKDVPEAVISKAKEKSQEIIGAYELICKIKGWK